MTTTAINVTPTLTDQTLLASECHDLLICSRCYFAWSNRMKYAHWVLGSCGATATSVGGIGVILNYLHATQWPLTYFLLALPLYAICVFADFKTEGDQAMKTGVEYNILYRKLSRISRMPADEARDQAYLAFETDRDNVERQNQVTIPTWLYEREKGAVKKEMMERENFETNLKIGKDGQQQSQQYYQLNHNL